MSKSYQKKKKQKSQPPPEDLKPIQIDETILSGQFNNQQRSPINSDMIAAVTSLIEKFEDLGLTDSDGLLLGSDEFNIEEFETKIQTILGNKKIKCNQQNLKKYCNFLQTTLETPCYLTGRENFSWEEEYLLGSGTSRTYERLKKKYPTHTDTFKLLEFSQTVSEIDGIFVEVERTSDRQQFTLPLADLVALTPDSLNYSIIEDYCIWFINYD
ncbi:MAG: calcium-binding protein [Microcoleaceae cyanobacterium]